MKKQLLKKLVALLLCATCLLTTQVSAAVRVDDGDALAGQGKYGAGLGTFGNGEGNFAV